MGLTAVDASTKRSRREAVADVAKGKSQGGRGKKKKSERGKKKGKKGREITKRKEGKK